MKRNTGISNRELVVQEIGYNGAERVGRTAAEGIERKWQLLQKGQKKGIFPEVRKSPWSWAGYGLAPHIAPLEMLLLMATLWPLDPKSPSPPWIRALFGNSVPVGRWDLTHAFGLKAIYWSAHLLCVEKMGQVLWTLKLWAVGCVQGLTSDTGGYRSLALEAWPSSALGPSPVSLPSCEALASGLPALPSCLHPTHMVLTPWESTLLCCEVCGLTLPSLLVLVNDNLSLYLTMPAFWNSQFFNDQETFERKRTLKWH